MLHHSAVSIATLACVLMALGCGKSKDSAGTEAPPAAATDQPKTAAPDVNKTPGPSMPASWKVTRDEVVAPENVSSVAARLGTELSALHNTVYEVRGQTIQINTLVAKDAKDAQALMAKMTSAKPAEFLLLKGNKIYEFVGETDAIPEMRVGKAHLEWSAK